VRIQGRKLKKVLGETGMTPRQLAEAIAEQGFGADDAERAINNWIVDRDHPRCKAPVIQKMAAALGRTGKDIAVFTSKVNSHRGSARKAGLLAQMIRGKSADRATEMLQFTTKKAAVNMLKCLKAAMRDAQNFDADTTRLVVSEARVDGAMVIKRFQPKDRGRAHPILKPLSHITISVEEKPASSLMM
jgi:large subunit ribosomal protein L22